MTNFKDFLLKLQNNLNILREREAKYATAAPLDLLNQIDDYEQAITLAEQAVAQDVPLDQLQAEFSGLNLRLDMVVFVAQEPPRQPFTGRNPYQGLRKFTETEAEFFFGRTEAIQTLVAQVTGLMEKPTSPAVPELLAILGASGSGKSSLVRAGLIPALRAGQVAGSEQWPIKVILPGPRPLEALAEVFLDKLERGMTAILAELAQGEKAFHHLIVEATQGQPDEARFILVIDQFEELFTLGENESERQTFLDQLLYACQIPRNRAFIILTMRADFYAKASVYKNLAQAITKNQMLVSPLTERELREAILLPAEAVGLELEKDLVQALVHDTVEAPGALPLLQHALDELFRRRDGNLLRMQSYQEIGGIRGGVAHRADGVMEQLNPEQQQMARRIFLRLIQPGEGTMDTRRRATFEEVLTQTTPTKEVEAIVQILADANLLITNRNPETNQVVLDVAHEALIQEWPTLRRWVREGRQGLRIRQHLSQATRDWIERGQDEGSLYRGVRLLEAQEWMAANRGEINPLEQIFLDTSIAFREREVTEKEAQRQRELKTAQKLAEEAEARRLVEAKRAEEQTQAAKRLRRLTLGLAVVLLLALAATFFAFWQSNIATARQLAANSLVAFTQGKFYLATLLALEANKLSPGEGSDTLTRIPYHAQYIKGFTFEGHTDVVYSVAWQPDGRHLASGSGDGRIIIWDVESGQKVTTLEGHTGAVYSVAWQPDGRRLASGSEDGRISIWDGDSGQKVTTLEGDTDDEVNSVAWQPDGRRLASGSGDGRIIIWDVESGQKVTTLGGYTGEVNSVAWQPDGRRLASGSGDGRISIWDVESGQKVTIPEGNTGAVYSVAWQPDGRRLASESGGRISIWDGESGQKVTTLEGDTGVVSNVAWQPDGRHLALGSEDGRISIWDGESGQTVTNLEGDTGWIYSVAWQPDGRHLASGSVDGRVIIWDVESRQKVTTLEGDTGAVRSVAWQPDGRRLASGSGDGRIIIWDGESGQKVTTLEGDTGAVSSVAWQPDGRRLASVSDDNRISISDDSRIIIWDGESGQNVTTLEGDTGAVRSVAWQPDGRHLALGSGDGRISIWDVESGQNVTTLEGDRGAVYSVAWQPDGRRLASVSEGLISIWDVESRQKVTIPERDTGWVSSMAWQPDGRHLASGSEDGRISIWDVESGQKVITLEGDTGWVSSMAWQPDGRHLASGSEDGRISIWDGESGQKITTLEGHTGAVRSVAWQPDGHRLASGSVDEKIQLLPEGFTHPPCQWLIYNLSVTEWLKYRGLAIYQPTCDNLQSPQISLQASLQDPRKLFLTLQGRLLLIGGAVLILGLIGLMMWGSFKLVRWIFNKWRRRKVGVVAG